MSGAVDTKTVEMRFDNKDFEANCKESISTLDKLKAALKLDGASKGLSEIEKASRKLDMKDLQGNVETVGRKFSALETIATGVFLKIGMAAADAGMKIVKSLTIDQLASGWSKYEEKTTAVQTIMANLRDDAEKFTDDISKMDYVNEQIEKLNWFSDETSYSLTDMTSNIGKFVANGQGLEESVTAMEGIATWAAISGQNSQTAARAMYNISQAMGTGAMKIKDWMSIENANMATAEFKETAIAIAQEKGKIKEGQVTIENFRESLSGKETNGWFDKEVMMATFEEYGSAVEKVRHKIEQVEEETGMEITASKAIQMLKKENAEFAKSLGLRAFAAAQEAKTLGEAIAATQDAVSTKWMQIFELVFGNYLQQKELWTDLANDLWDVFAAPLDRIKSIMEIWNEGFGDESGREHVIQGLKNIFDALFHDTDEGISLLGVLKESFASVFGLDQDAKSLGEQLWNLTKRFKDFTETLKPSEETIEKLRNTFEGFFTLLKIGGRLVSSIIKPFTQLFGKVFGIVGKNALNASSGLGAWIKNFDAFLEQNKVFERISNYISASFDKIASAVNSLSMALTGMSFGELMSSVKTGFLEGLNNFIDGVKAIFSKDTENLTDGAARFKQFLGLLGDVFASVKTVLSGLVGPVGKVFSLLGTVFQKTSSMLSAALEKDGIFGLLKVAAKLGVAVLIGKFFLSLINTLSLARKAGWVLDDLFGIFKQLKGVFKAFQFKLYAEGVKSIAVAIALLALAVMALGQMDRGQLAQGLLALLAITGVIALLKQIVNGITVLSGLGAAAAFAAFAVAIGLLTVAVYALGSMDQSKVSQGIAAILALTLIFGLFRAMMGTVGGINLLGAAAAFTLFGVAVDILAIGVYALGSMSSTDLTEALVAIATLVAIFGIFKNFCTTVTGINLIAAAAAFTLFGVAVDILAIGVYALGSMSSTDLTEALVAIATLVAIFGIFKNFCTTVTGINLIAAAAAFALFGVAVDILAIGVYALGSMSSSDLTKALAAIATLVAIFGIFKNFCTTVTGIDLLGATVAFLAFAAAVDIITIGVAALGAMPVNDLTEALVAIATLVAIFGVFKTFCSTATSIDLIGATVAFGLFAVAVDIIAVGVAALGKLDVGQITNGIVAVGAMVLLYGVLNSLAAGSGGMTISAAGFLTFSVAIIAVSAALNLLVPVMETISGMGDSWWQPLAFLGGALALILASGAIAGLPLVSEGLIILTVALIGISAACLLAGAGIYLISEGFADLVEAIAKYGPEAAANVGSLVNAILDTIISSAPKMTAAALVLLTSFALGLIGSANILATAALTLLVTLLNVFAAGIPALADAIVVLIAAALNAIASVIRGASGLILPAVANILSAVIELVLEVLAGLVGLIPGVGSSLAGKIREWKGSVNDALTHVFSDAESIGAEGAASVIEGFSGGGGGHGFYSAGEKGGSELLSGAAAGMASARETGQQGGKDVSEGFNQEISNAGSTTTKDAATDFMSTINSIISQGSTDGVDSFNLDFLKGITDSFGEFDIASLTEGKMGDFLSGITSGGADASEAFKGVLEGFGTDLSGFDLSGLTSEKMSEMPEAINEKQGEVSEASDGIKTAVSTPISEAVGQSNGWGTDLGNNFASGVRAAIPAVEAAAKAMAAAVSAFLHFSEPDVGPLSDFHTYAPDMIKLWCKGVYSNLNKVEDSSESMADTVYDGFSTALEYVSDLINDGMSDELAIRPVMDLSEIQNGVRSLDSMISGADGYSLSGTARLASSAARGFSSNGSVNAGSSTVATNGPVTNYNTFNITNNDPAAVAEKVSRLIGQETKRAQAVWAR